MRRKIAFIAPIRFAFRGFWQTGIIPKLAEQADILLISPFATSDSFFHTYSHPGVSHALLKDFKPAGTHGAVFYLRQETQRKHLNLVGLNIRDDVSRYFNSLQPGASERPKRRYLLRNALTNPVGLTLLTWLERRTYERQNYAEHAYYMAMMKKFQPDLVISTSPNRDQEIPIARVVEALKIPQIAYILSFDNIVCYDDYPRVYDRYLVWNERNKQEIIDRYHVGRDRVEVCGPLQFDFYSRKDQYLVSREEWAAQNHIPADPPVILYSEAGHVVAPHETDIVADLCRRLRALNLAVKPTMLVRLHPMYGLERWKGIREEFPEVFFQETNTLRAKSTSLSYADNVDWSDEDIKQLINTLYHTALNVNVSSTMALDAAYFDRPSICIAYDPTPAHRYDQICKRLYDREHYLDIVSSKAVPIAQNPEEAVNDIQFSLENPHHKSAERRQMLKHYDPFIDGCAADRVYNAIMTSLRRGN